LRDDFLVKLYVRTETNRYTRILVVEGGGKIKLYGDPVKTVASLLIFNNSSVKGWVREKGLEVEATPETWEALKALSAKPLTWKQAAEWSFLQNPTAEMILRTLSLNALVFK
jgi:ABC-type glycerol-3-phosphate transport system substrate-binding protein